MKLEYKSAIAVLILLAMAGTIALAMAEASTTEIASSDGGPDITNPSSFSSERKYIIESRRYIGEDGKTTFDTWVTSGKVMKIDKNSQYVVFYPLEGEHAGKKHYMPFSNIHIIREL